MEWKTSISPVSYGEALKAMESRARAVRDGRADELVWLLEHPALYTAGSSADAGDLIDAKGLPVYHTGRGGQYTWHGPGQRVVYIMLDLKRRKPDVRLYVQNLERWIIATLARFGIEGFIREGRVGVWVNKNSSPSRGEVRRGAEGTHRYPLTTILQNARLSRSDMTDAEKSLWHVLRAEKIGVKFRKQHPVGKYIADFACLNPKLIIELDGGQHGLDVNIKKDEERTSFLKQQGFHVLRFWNNDILNNMEGVFQVICAAIDDRLAHTRPHPNPPPTGEGISNEAKIAAIGVRLHQWVTYHGIAINVNPDLKYYEGIVPCGIREYGVTSLHALGIKIDIHTLDEALKETFAEVF